MTNQVNQKQNVITPAFLAQFKCIGGECENTCCRSWSIVVSQDVRNKIEKHLKSSLSSEIPIKEYFDAVQGNFKFKLDQEGNCPFLTADQLCQLQTTGGEQLLPSVCQEFPRKNLRYNNSLLLSASISCPEIARKVLLNPNSLALVQSASQLNNYPEFYLSERPELELNFKQIAFNVLSHKTLVTNEDKLCVLALLFNLTAQAITNDESLENLFSDFEYELENGNLALTTEQYSFSKPMYSLLIDALAKPFFNLPNAIYAYFYGKFINESIKKSFIEDVQHGYAQFCELHNDKYSQFLRHWVYHNHFNLKSANDIYYQMATLIFQINYIRTLIGLTYPGTPAQEHDKLITDIFHSTARGYAHNININLIVKLELEKLNLDSPVSLLTLSKF